MNTKQIEDGAVKKREWIYDPQAGIPIWVARRWHKIGSEQKLETTSGLVAYPGDKICQLFEGEAESVMWCEPKLPENFRYVDNFGGHVWGYWKQDKFQSCARCLACRRADNKNSPCRGKVKLREMDLSKGMPV